MPDDMEILHEMIRDTARISIEEPNGRRQITLGEPRDRKGRNVRIVGLPENTIAIEADKFPAPDAMFAGSKGERRRADFIIIANTGKKRVILCIEMKAVRGKESEIVQQLKGARCLVGYCGEIGRTFWNSRKFLKDYQYRFIKIAPADIDKRPMRRRRETRIHDRPENMLKIHCPKDYRLQFNRLAGKGDTA